jgi:aldose 1-epimerase
VTSSEPSTIQLSLEGGRGVVRATIDRVGASLNNAEIDGVEVVPGWHADVSRPFSAGVTLAPWPNRIRDGRWSWEGEDLQLKVSEPDRQTALHGLVADALWDVSNHTSFSVTLVTRIDPTPGYPFALALSMDYLLRDGGVECSFTAVNIGDAPAPCAVGFHPFLCLGRHPVRSLTLHSPVSEVVVVDDRLLPIGIDEARHSPFNPAGGVALAHAQFDTGFRLEGEGPWVTRLVAADETSVELWQSEHLGWIQFFLTDEFPGPRGAQSALAVEPMSAPADAFNSGTDLWVLEPGQQTQARWGIRLG